MPTPETEGPGQILFEFVRHWARRWNTTGEGSADRNGRMVLVTEAVRSLTVRGAVTINALAAEIGIDQSGASRLVKEAVSAGYLTLAPSGSDARRREVSITDTGLTLLADAHRWQEAVFDQLTAEWTTDERDDFHRAMLRLLHTSHTLGA